MRHVLSLMLIALLAAPCVAASEPKPSLQQELANLKIPPAWLDDIPVNWDVNRPWKEGRLEVRRLLALKGENLRKAIKITWLYYKKNDIGDGHELPMYLFLGQEYAWAVVEYEKYVEKNRGRGGTHAYSALASLYMHFGEYDKARATLEAAMNDLPKDPWRISNMANVHSHLGDYYREIGNIEKAREHYQQAIKLYPTSNQPWGRHLLKRQADRVQAQLDLLTMQSLANVRLKDGVYKGASLGYNQEKDVVVTLTVRNGKMAKIDVDHDEKIDLDAAVIVPRRIIEQQGLQVDAITGATITSQAIIDATLQAVRKAGAK